jgi:predicted Holliday junction resolvase-like endonuclease
MEWKIILILVVLVVVLLVLYLSTRQKLKELEFQKRSLSSKYGKMTEQFLPFLEDYPYDSQNFRFLGTPIDGVQFEGDKIIFVEFKTAKSQLNEKQRNIRDLVNEREVIFEEHRIE